MCRRWSVEDDRALYEMHDAGKLDLTEMAQALQRGNSGTAARLRRLLDVNSKQYLRLFGAPGLSHRDSQPAGVGGGGGGAGLRPFSDILSKLLFDPSLNPSDFFFVYEDRYDGEVVRCADEPNEKVKGPERLLIKAIPEHRIKRLLFKQRVVWDRDNRADFVFGSGANGNGVKLEEIIAGYEAWETAEKADEEKRRNVQVQVFCDLDGVLADFDGGVVRLFGRGPDEVSKKQMWGRIASQKEGGGFFASLGWTLNGRKLWNAIRDLTPQPVILTGVPMGNWAPQQKLQWCARELGSHVRIITCMSKDKCKFCATTAPAPEAASADAAQPCVSILIDDREMAREPWVNAGGVFILYSDDRIDDVLSELRDHGVAGMVF